MNVSIIIFAIILLLGLLYYEKKKNRMLLLITKSVLSLLFVMTALLQPHSVPAYFHYLFVGMCYLIDFGAACYVPIVSKLICPFCNGSFPTFFQVNLSYYPLSKDL